MDAKAVNKTIALSKEKFGEEIKKLNREDMKKVLATLLVKGYTTTDAEKLIEGFEIYFFNRDSDGVSVPEEISSPVEEAKPTAEETPTTE